MEDIPDDVLVKHEGFFKKRILARGAFLLERDRPNGLEHEAFHHFFSTMFELPGYKGPRIAKALRLAINGIELRFGSAATFIVYSPGLPGILSNLGYFNSNNIDTWIEKIVLTYDLVDYARTLAIVSSKNDDPHSNAKYLSQFIDEFLASIYGGFFGDTPEAILARHKEIRAKFSLPPQYTLNDLRRNFNKPSSQELEFLGKMTWEGASILP